MEQMRVFKSLISYFLLLSPFNSLIINVVFLQSETECAKSSTTQRTFQDMPLLLDDYGEDDWIEIDDMYIVSKYFRSGLSDVSFRWELGIIPYEFKEGDFDEEQQNFIVSIMDYISEFTCIRFVSNENNTYENYLYIRNSRGFSAAVGNTRTGPQWMVLETNDNLMGQTHPGYYYSGAVAHELIHAIGFEHEHQRNDRDYYIDINYENINDDSYTMRNFLKLGDFGIPQENFSVPYNYESIMQYPSIAFSKNWKPAMTPKTYLAEGIPYPMRGSVDSDGVPVLGQTSYLSRGDILMIQAMYAGICPDTSEDSNGGPLTTNITDNRFKPLPKPRQLLQNLQQQSTTSKVTSTTSTTTTMATTTLAETPSSTTSTVSSLTTSSVSNSDPNLSTSTSKSNSNMSTTTPSPVDNGIGAISNGLKPPSGSSG